MWILKKEFYGLMNSQEYPLDQVTETMGGQKSISKGTLTVYINGIASE